MTRGLPLAVSPAFVREQPEATQRFVTATVRGMRDYYHTFFARDVDKSPVVQILVNHTPVKDPRLYDVIGLGRVEPNPSLDFSAWRQLQAYFVKMGLQQRVLDPNAYVDDTYVTRALEILGRE